MKYKEITSVEVAGNVHGRNVNALTRENLTELGVDPKFQDWLISNYQLAIVTEAMNTDEEGKVWEPDYNNLNQLKFTPAYVVDANAEHPGGVGFSSSDCDLWHSGTNVGARLTLDTTDKVSHIQTYFKNLHLDQQLIRK